MSNGSSSNPPTGASAVGVIYDFASTASFDLKSAVQTLEIAVHDEEVTVVATHRSIRLDGGPDFDEDGARERTITQAHALSKREPGSLKLATFDHGTMPFNRHFRVDPSPGHPEVLDVPELP